MTPAVSGTSAWQRLRQRRDVWVIGTILLLLVLGCFLVPELSPYTYDQQDIAKGITGPSAAHWMGTDQLGRDLLTRSFYGGRVSILVGLAATAVALLIGVCVGVTSGYFGGKVDSFLMRLVEVLSALPFTVFVILLMVVFQDVTWVDSFFLVLVAIGLVEWLTMARVIRGASLGIRALAFVDAARQLGQSHGRIMARHILPNTMGTILVYATLTVPGVMLLEAFLSFLGLGVTAPQTSWGALIHDGASVMERYPWMLLFPSALFTITLFCVNYLGDAVRDALDPRR